MSAQPLILPNHPIIMILTRGKDGKLIEPQVSPGDDYTFSVGKFDDALSTLGDAMYYNIGAKFSTRLESKDK